MMYHIDYISAFSNITSTQHHNMSMKEQSLKHNILTLNRRTSLRNNKGRGRCNDCKEGNSSLHCRY